MQTIVWEVECLSSVKVRRHCKKCGDKTEFASSGLFRVNANKKRLDVWLVYRCTHCGTSWNLPVHERIRPDRLPREQLEGFTQNDEGLARRYAMDAGLLARHGCQVSPPEYAITGEAPPKGRAVRVVLHSAVPLPIRVGKLLRQKLGLSAGELDALLKSGSIRPLDGGDLHRQKLGNEAQVSIHLEAQAENETAVQAAATPKKAVNHGRGRCVWFMPSAAPAHICQGSMAYVKLAYPKSHGQRRPVFPAKMQLPYIRC